MADSLKCRVCEDGYLHTVLQLGEQYLTGVFAKEPHGEITRGNLELMWCQSCRLVQLKDTFDLAEMYGDNYGYRSGLNPSMVAHLTNKIHNLEARVKLEPGE